MLKLTIYNRLGEEDEADVQVITYWGVRKISFENQDDNGTWFRIYFHKGTKNYKRYGVYLYCEFDPSHETFSITNSEVDKCEANVDRYYHECWTYNERKHKVC